MAARTPVPIASRRVLDWLLEDEQPGVRFRTLTELLDRPSGDPEVRAARARIPSVGWGAEILSGRRPWGGWEVEPNLYTPKYTATTWQMLTLADLGLDRSVESFRPTIELWAGRFTGATGILGAFYAGKPHHCLSGNMARAMIRFGYADDPRVTATMQWLAGSASPLGGWSCWGTGRNLDSWEGLGAFAEYPRERWTAPMRTCVDRATEFFLQRELHRQGGPYAPWRRFHHPVHYYYDLLVGLDLLTALGDARDPRLGYALSVLRAKRRRDGRWNLDAVHPDVGGGTAAFYRAHPSKRPTPLALEVPGRPSKMITLAALRVLKRIASRPLRPLARAKDADPPHRERRVAAKTPGRSGPR